MIEAQLAAAWSGRHYLAVARRVRGDADDRGDVPGWVMITVMSAGLVVVIFGVFKAKIATAVSDAIDSVTGQTSK